MDCEQVIVEAAKKLFLAKETMKNTEDAAQRYTPPCRRHADPNSRKKNPCSMCAAWNRRYEVRNVFMSAEKEAAKATRDLLAAAGQLCAKDAAEAATQT